MKRFFMELYKDLFKARVVSMEFKPILILTPVINRELSEIKSLIHKAGELEKEGFLNASIKLLDIAIFQCVNQKDRIIRELKSNSDLKVNSHE